MLKQSQGGFTLIEITIAILILTTALLGLGASTGRMIAPAGQAELEFKALQSVEDRLAAIRLEPRYGLLDSLFAGVQSSLPGLTGFTRTTSVTRHQIAQSGAKVLDYTEVVVTVSGPGLINDRYRKLVLGAP
jgi:prepilin-type N-terminal cleavage/methylation domain-containing protein